MKTDAANDVKVIQKNGISVRIRPTLKDGTTYFVLDYRAKGKRKLVWRSTMAEARTAANEAIDKITDGTAEVLNLTSNNAHVYLRARDALEGIPKDLDEVAREYAESYLLLRGTGSVLEACRDWARRHAVELPRITVPDAVAEFLKQCKVDGKSTLRLRDHQTILNRFAGAINLEVSAVEPKLF